MGVRETNKSPWQEEILSKLGKKAELRREGPLAGSEALVLPGYDGKRGLGPRGGLAIAGRPQLGRENLNATHNTLGAETWARGAKRGAAWPLLRRGPNLRE